MTRRSEALVVLLVTVFVVATCAVLLAHAGVAEAEACGRTQLLASAKPGTESPATVLVDAAWLSAGFLRWSRPAAPVSMCVPDHCGFRASEFLAAAPITRAPPLA